MEKTTTEEQVPAVLYKRETKLGNLNAAIHDVQNINP